MKKLIALTCAICIAVLVCPAVAAPTFFTSRAAFNAATGGGLNFESFENDFGPIATVAFAGFTVSETQGADYLAQARNYPYYSWASSFITDGTGALWYDDNGDSIGTFFGFNSPVTAFGIDIAADENTVVTIGGSTNYSLGLTALRSSFWGVIDTAGLTSLSFNASGGPDIGFDSCSYGSSCPTVPAPGAILLGGIGVSLVGWMRRKRAL